MTLAVVPLTLRVANDFVAKHHRHSERTARNGGKFAIGAEAAGRLVGVAIVGNPVSASLMDGVTAEVLRVCVLPDAPRNTCSFLYGRCWRIWQQMGGQRMITYTLSKESGASLRGAGWRVMGVVKPHDRWRSKAKSDGVRRKQQGIYREEKRRWEVAHGPRARNLKLEDLL